MSVLLVFLFVLLEVLCDMLGRRVEERSGCVVLPTFFYCQVFNLKGTGIVQIFLVKG
jgi:hypothetical protein